MMVTVEGPEVADRRRFERIAMRIPVIHQRIGKEALGDAFTVDISASGMQAFFDRNFRINQRLKLWLDFPETEKPLTAQGRVVWRMRKNETTWRIGVEFDEVNLIGLRPILENR